MTHSLPPAGTCFTRVTPAGRGAVATVAVWGPRAATRLREYFEPRSERAWEGTLAGTGLVLGRWLHNRPLGSRDELVGAAEVRSEEVVVASTGEDQLEVHCHGGRAAVQAICQALRASGAVEVDQQSWRRRVEDNAIAREALEDLSLAATERTAGILLHQYHGALQRRLLEVAEQLPADPAAAQQQLRRLLELAPTGLRLATGWRVVVGGAPNVGKSSLVNRLLGFQRAIVFDRPGTTRDMLSAATAVDGWPIQLTDTAGIRGTSDELEQQGVSLARQAISQADLVLLVCDASQPPANFGKTSAERKPSSVHPLWSDFGLPSAVDEAPETGASEMGASEKGAPETTRPPGRSNLPAAGAVLVWNKCDLVDDGELTRNSLRLAEQLPEARVSALTGFGIEELLDSLGRRLVDRVPEAGEAIPFRARHVAAIQDAVRAIDDGQTEAARDALLGLLEG